jgi:beta-N-acetylhexosaminidase
VAVSSSVLRVLAAVVAAIVLGVAAAWWMSSARLGPDVLGASQTSESSPRPTREAPSTATSTATPSPEPSEVAASTLPPACAALPLARRAALVLVVGMPEVTSPDDPLVGELTELGVGGVFLAGYNVESTEQVRAVVDALRSGDRPRPLIATDEEWGRVSSFRDVFGSTSSPRTLAATRSAAQVRAAARDLGRSLKDVGIDWNFAPVADLDDGPDNGVIGDRAFAGAPDAAGDYARAFARGLDAGGVLPTVKHFPGHGAVPGDIDPHSKTVESKATLAQLRDRHLPPFEKLIADDVPVVMLNHVTYAAVGDLPASMSPHAYRMLRDLGFDGVAITDSIGMGAVHRRWDFPQATVRAIRAGADAVLATDGRHAQEMRDQLVDAVRAGRLDEQRLNEAAARVLALRGDPSPCSPSEAASTPASATPTSARRVVPARAKRRSRPPGSGP